MEHLAVIYSFLKDYVEFPKLNLPKNEKYASPPKLDGYYVNLGIRRRTYIGYDPSFEENGVIATMFRTSTDDIDAFSQLIEVDGQDIFLLHCPKIKILQ